ncbi:succinate dehydrogenase/fumarate reductase flavoprotein subunit [Desulfobacter hydrogenophilus]|uniref:FAD-binding protein n=1 Tax=Desulfobacter hydrogenophilus TaxID=2291 RepID=A0A328FDA9_9BACT|nr:FAD-binding protein [Desulfobacter hydrogenophilus]NDY74396.1 FAD-binding protein [Desulfobacter hydrogenophilus]QBH14385.1 FAD-binding protein [Desulfobacter hydrogenophilus]RAM02289.1 succinate dehydrogenase/fumarate reductase flavoprotein subunit [Desulfobacter hydrogenophilus]
MTSSQKSKGVSRRKFITLAGGAAGLATMAVIGLFPEQGACSANVPEIDIDKIKNAENETDVLVIGGGMAGLFAAVKAHDAGSKVMLVSKGRLGSSGQTPFAKGIFSFDPDSEKMSLDEFTDKVSRSALGTNNPVYTRQMAEHSLSRVNELKEWGFFDSPLYNKSFSNPVEKRNIPVKERIVITHLIKEKGRIAGAAGFSLDEEKVHFFKAKSVILCTGAGGFKPNGFPICDLTHDGTVMAYNIGAKVTGKEWNDGHPGQAEHPAACFDGWHGMFERKPGTTGVEVHHDLGMDLNYKAYMNGNPVKMGPPGAGGEKEPEGGPYVPDEFKRNGHPGGERGPKDGKRPGPGGPPKEGGAPPGMGGTSVGGSSAGMAIHKSEGLTPINEKCESTIPGLYAAGDALGSYMAGAIYTQIGSSLAGSAVQGGVAGKAAAEYCQGVKMPEISKSKMNEVQAQILAPLKKESGYSPAWVTQTLQGIMIPNFIIYIKKERLLNAALAYVEELRDHHIPMLKAANLHELRLAFETANMIISAEMKLKASLMRKESRCSHYRLDYPQTDTQNWNAWINIYKGSDGSMKFEKQPFGTWPA